MNINWINYSPELIVFFIPKVIIALFCGGIIGLERELKGRWAGLRTCILICLGATLYSAFSLWTFKVYNTGDPTRLAAQIVSGIGFLGGGVILQLKGSIYGITTAATIWTLAAVGVLIGQEMSEIAIPSSLIIVAVLFVVRLFEEKITNRLSGKSSGPISQVHVNVPLEESKAVIDFIKTNLSGTINEVSGNNDCHIEISISPDSAQAAYELISKNFTVNSFKIKY